MSRIQQIDFSLDVMRVLLWQYNDATRLQTVLQDKQDWINDNQRDFWSNWFTDVFDLRTCNEFGLSVWSIILGLPLGVKADPRTFKSWGFGQYRKNFGNGNFAPSEGGSKYLTTSERRVLLRLRALQLFTNGSLGGVNEALPGIFGTSAIAIDNMDMSISYVLGATSQKMVNAMIDFDVLPRPSGVKIKSVTFYDPSYFGWQGQVNADTFGELTDAEIGAPWAQTFYFD